MARMTWDEIRKLKADLWKEYDKSKNKVHREQFGYGILVLQQVLDEQP